VSDNGHTFQVLVHNVCDCIACIITNTMIVSSFKLICIMPLNALNWLIRFFGNCNLYKLLWLFLVSTYQLVPAVTELVIAELMFLHWMDHKEPISIYINSTGTTRADSESVIGWHLACYIEMFDVLSALGHVLCMVQLMHLLFLTLGGDGDRRFCHLWCNDADENSGLFLLTDNALKIIFKELWWIIG